MLPNTDRANQPGLFWPRLAVCVMLVVFAVACFCPAVKLTLMGAVDLVSGWKCLTVGILSCPPLWVANPLFFAGCLFLVAGRNAAAFLWGLSATLLVFGCLTGPLDGALSLTSGGYLWFGNMVFLTVFAGIRSRLYGDYEPRPVEPFPSPRGAAMKDDANTPNEDVVRVYAGSILSVELYQQALKEAGVESKVVGLALSASFGSAMPDSVELWVKSEDADKATAAIQRFESEKEAAV